jgi:hypothetical protein
VPSPEDRPRLWSVDNRLSGSCWDMNDMRYRSRARAGLTSSSVMQASGLTFASGCGSVVFRAGRRLVVSVVGVGRIHRLTTTEGLREPRVSAPERHLCWALGDGYHVFGFAESHRRCPSESWSAHVGEL